MPENGVALNTRCWLLCSASPFMKPLWVRLARRMGSRLVERRDRLLLLPGLSMLRSLLLAACTLMLAGCVTVSNTLAPEQIGAFKLTKVDVVYAPDAIVTWGDGQAAYAAHRGVAHDPFAAATPDSIAYERD